MLLCLCMLDPAILWVICNIQTSKLSFYPNLLAWYTWLELCRNDTPCLLVFPWDHERMINGKRILFDSTATFKMGGYDGTRR